MAIIGAVLSFLRRTHLLSVPCDNPIVRRYIDAGREFGHAVSYAGTVDDPTLNRLLLEWEAAEREYAALGYRTISLDAFVQHGGWGQPLEGICVPREVRPIFHATYYRTAFNHDYFSVMDLTTILRRQGLIRTRS